MQNRHDLSDEQWALLCPLLPVERRGGAGSALVAASPGGERDLVADSDGLSVAGSACGVRGVANGVWQASDVVG